MFLKLYSVVLGVYPASFKARFGTEMLAVFEQRAIHMHGRGAFLFGKFLIREIGAVFSGALLARVGRKVHSTPYELAFPSDIDSAEKYIEVVSGNLIRAIANHDFVNARYFDAQDRKARALLAKLRSATHPS